MAGLGLARWGMAGRGKNTMFQPKGKKPLWEMVYDGIVDLNVGDVVTFEQLEDLLQTDPLINRGSILKASKVLLKKHHRELVSMRGVGYKIVEGVDIAYLAEDRHKKAKKQLGMANFEMTNIDTIKLSPDEKKKVHDLMVHNANIRMAFVQNAKAIEAGVTATRTQLTGVEAQLAGAQITQLFTEQQVKKLKELIGE